jgi:hypothetical protein
MSERSASLRKRPAAVVAPEDNGSRAKRAASAYLLAGGSNNLREVADEYGVECAHVHYYLRKWKGTAMQDYFESGKQAEEISTRYRVPRAPAVRSVLSGI